MSPNSGRLYKSGTRVEMPLMRRSQYNSPVQKSQHSMSNSSGSRTPTIVNQSRRFSQERVDSRYSQSMSISMDMNYRAIPKTSTLNPALTKAIIVACQHLSNLKQDEKRLRQECKAMKRHIINNEARIHELGESLSKKMSIVQEVEEDISRLQDEKDILLNKINDQETRLREYNEKISVYYENATVEISGVKGKIAGLLDEFDVAKENRYALEEELKKVRQERIVLESLKARKTSELSSLISTAKRQIEEMEREKQSIITLLDSKIADFKRIEMDKI